MVSAILRDTFAQILPGKVVKRYGTSKSRSVTKTVTGKNTQIMYASVCDTFLYFRVVGVWKLHSFLDSSFQRKNNIPLRWTHGPTLRIRALERKWICVRHRVRSTRGCPPGLDQHMDKELKWEWGRDLNFAWLIIDFPFVSASLAYDEKHTNKS